MDLSLILDDFYSIGRRRELLWIKSMPAGPDR
jgi:hypothetical protein